MVAEQNEIRVLENDWKTLENASGAKPLSH